MDQESLPHVGIVFCLGLFFVLDLFSVPEQREDGWFYVIISIGFLGSSFLPRLKRGFDNNLVPACVIVALLGGLAVGKYLSSLKAASSTRKYLFKSYVLTLCAFQFMMLLYDPFSHIPTPEDLKAGNQFIATLKNIEGKVFFPGHGYYSVLAGKKVQAHFAAIWDVWTGRNDGVKQKFIEEIRHAIIEKQFQALVLNDYEGWLSDDISQLIHTYYRKKLKFFEDPSVFRPLINAKTRPEYLFIPKED